MAINIEDFRKSLNVDLSRDLVQKILTKYENFDFSNVSTNNGSKLSIIDAIDSENIKETDVLPYIEFINKDVRRSYIKSKNAEYKIMFSAPEEVKKIANDIDKVLTASLYSRPNSTTITSKLLFDIPQNEEPIHLLTINTDSSNIFAVVNSLVNDFSKYGIPFDIEFPKRGNFTEGKTEAIKLRVTTSDLEDTIKGIARIYEVYKTKIKKPNMFNANVKDIMGYDSLIDVNGTRTSDLLGMAIVKAIDTTIVELAKEESFDGLSVVDYIKNAENKDLARQKVIKTVKQKYPNIIDPVLQNTKEAIKKDGLAVDIDNVYISKRAADELNDKYGIVEDVVINVNEVVEEKEDKLSPIKEAAVEAISPAIVKAADIVNTIKDGVEVIKNPVQNMFIQPAIDFGAGSIEKIAEEAENITKSEPSDELKVENPSVTVIEPIQKAEEFNTIEEPVFDKIEENQAPVLTAEAINEEPTAYLPGEEGFAVNEPSMATGIKEVITPESVIETTPIVAPTIEATPIVVQSEPVQTEVVEAQPVEATPVVEEPKVEAPIFEPVEVTPVEPVVETTPVVEPVVQEVVAPVVETTPVQVDLDKTQVFEPVVDTQETQSIQDEIKEEATKENDDLQVSSLEEFINEPTAPVASAQETVTTPVVEPVVQETKAQTPAVEEDDEIEKMLKSIESNVSESTIEFTDEEKQEVNNQIPESLNLTTPERVAQIADEVIKERNIDPEREARKARYYGILVDGHDLDFHIKDKDNQDISKEDGTPYTLLDYLDEQDVLSKIQLDSKYYIRDNPSVEYVDGKTFIKDFIVPNSVNGNRSVEEIIDWYVSKITNINEQPKKKGLFGFGKK